MSRKIGLYLVATAIALLTFATADEAQAWGRRGGGSCGSWGGYNSDNDNGSHGSFGGRFFRRHGSFGSRGGRGSHGNHGSHGGYNRCESSCDTCNSCESSSDSRSTCGEPHEVQYNDGEERHDVQPAPESPEEAKAAEEHQAGYRDVESDPQTDQELEADRNDQRAAEQADDQSREANQDQAPSPVAKEGDNAQRNPELNPPERPASDVPKAAEQAYEAAENSGT